MSYELDEQRPFEPTPRRRQQARDAGDVARSPALTGALGWLAGIGALRLASPWIGGRLAELGTTSWSSSPSGAINAAALVDQLQWWLLQALVVAAPILIAVTLAVIFGHLAQCGWLWLPDKLSVQADRLGVARAWQRWAAGETVRSAAGELMQLAAGLAVVSWRIWIAWPTLAHWVSKPMFELATASYFFVLDTALWAGGAWLLVGLVDFVWIWRRREQRLHLTREEARQEAAE